MADVKLETVDSGSQRRRFIRLPWRIYADDPSWVPPLIHSQEELLGFRPHPFYERSRARSFLAVRGGRDVGRITAIVNAGHVERYGEQRGFFGFFECDDDPAAARSLFGAAREWLHAEGMTAIRGPTNPSLNYECGLLIEGFDTPPFFMMTHARPWYGGLVEDNGFGKVEDLANGRPHRFRVGEALRRESRHQFNAATRRRFVIRQRLRHHLAADVGAETQPERFFPVR